MYSNMFSTSIFMAFTMSSTNTNSISSSITLMSSTILSNTRSEGELGKVWWIPLSWACTKIRRFPSPTINSHLLLSYH